MALPSSGSIALSQVNTELSKASNALITMNDSAVRSLFGKASGAISMSDGRGKSAVVNVSLTISANTANYVLQPSVVPGYQAGKTNVTLTINSGVKVYSTSTGTAALRVQSFAAGDVVTIVNNGTIAGMGGAGGRGDSWDVANPIPATNGAGGGPALQVSFATRVTNNGTIAGGGGGGGGGPGMSVSTKEGLSSYAGGGGGGGAGLNAGGGGAAGYGGNTGAATAGGSGSETGGGGGGVSPFDPNYKGGAGGARGSAGGRGRAFDTEMAGYGGAAGSCTLGNGNITWLATGTRLGPLN